MYKKREFTNFIVIHSSATKPDMDIGAKDIDKWHKDRGWSGIGYHYVIKRDGTVEEGRPIDTVGAHVKGWNNVSVGICVVGGINDRGEAQKNFTKEQFKSLTRLVHLLTVEYPYADIRGHRDMLAAHTLCPSFDVPLWWAEASGHEEGTIDAIAEIYKLMIKYPKTSEVYNVLEKLLNTLGEKE